MRFGVIDNLFELLVLGLVLYWVFSPQSNFGESVSRLGEATTSLMRTLQGR